MAITQYSPRRVLAKLVSLAPEREIFLRTAGKVHFLRITTRAQLLVAGATVTLLGGWAAGTGAMLWNQAHLSAERATLVRDRAAVDQRAAKVDAVRRSVDDVASDIEARQDAMQEMIRSSLGSEPAPAKPAVAPKTGVPVSRAGGQADRLNHLQQQQFALEDQLEAAAKVRLAKVEQAIRSFGLNPAALNGGGEGQLGRGGPFIPARGLIASDPDLRGIALLLGRLNAMEATLAAIPSGRPTSAPMETSSFGYRRDPFNGYPAFHAGIDFPGRYGQPIVAAAAGRVSYVGRRQGYGNVVEIDHGNGIQTRYAHLSRFGTHVGETVTRGQDIARMGSTGRSTGTHLHFEVRVRGAAVNPRRFVEARPDVLEIQQLAKARIVRGNRR